VTITAQLDLAFNPLERRGAGGEWGSGGSAASIKAHDTASATAKAKIAARIAAVDARAAAVNAQLTARQQSAGADARAKLAADWDADRKARAAARLAAALTVPEADPADADSPVNKQLDADFASGIKEAQSPKDRARKAGLNPKYFGNSAQTSVVTFGNGHQWIRKRGLDEDEMHREVLVSRISDVLGAGAPQVTLRRPAVMPGEQSEDQEMWEPMVPNAQPAAVARPSSPFNPYAMMSSRQGTKIGIMDTITSNGDRHEGNWMVQHDDATGEDTPVPIDHGRAMMDDSQSADYGGTGPFGEHLFQYGADSEQLAAVPKEAWATWQKGVKALEPQFKAAGMRGQFVNVQAALSAAAHLSARAKKEVPKSTGQPFTPDAPELWTGPTE